MICAGLALLEQRPPSDLKLRARVSALSATLLLAGLSCPAIMNSSIATSTTHRNKLSLLKATTELLTTSIKNIKRETDHDKVEKSGAKASLQELERLYEGVRHEMEDALMEESEKMEETHVKAKSEKSDRNLETQRLLKTVQEIYHTDLHHIEYAKTQKCTLFEPFLKQKQREARTLETVSERILQQYLSAVQNPFFFNSKDFQRVRQSASVSSTTAHCTCLFNRSETLDFIPIHIFAIFFYHVLAMFLPIAHCPSSIASSGCCCPPFFESPYSNGNKTD